MGVHEVRSIRLLQPAVEAPLAEAVKATMQVLRALLLQGKVT